jgi:hypothetical protein
MMVVSVVGTMSVSASEDTSRSSGRASFSYGTLGFGVGVPESDEESMASDERAELLKQFIEEHDLKPLYSSELRGRSGFYLALSEIEDERPVLRFGAARGDAISYARVIYFEESVVAKTILFQEFSKDLRERGFEISVDEESAPLVLYDHIDIAVVMGFANAICERYKPLKSIETMLDDARERERAHELKMAQLRLDQLRLELEIAQIRERSLEQLRLAAEIARTRERSPEQRAHELALAQIELELAKIRERSLEQLRLEAEIIRSRK